MKNGVVALAIISTALVAGKAEAQGYCREFSQGVSIGGQIQSSYGVACMQPDGSWQVASGGQGYGNPGYAPVPVPVPVRSVYVSPPAVYYPPPASPGFSLNIGIPFRHGHGDCGGRGHWRGHGYGHGHHDDWHPGRGAGYGAGYGAGWGAGWGAGRHGHHGWRD